MPKENKIKTGKWGKVELDRFMKALEKYGKNWVMVQRAVKSRTLPQVRSHAQKMFQLMSQEELSKLERRISRRFQYFCANSEKNIDYQSQKPSKKNHKQESGSDNNQLAGQRSVFLKKNQESKAKTTNKNQENKEIQKSESPKTESENRMNLFEAYLQQSNSLCPQIFPSLQTPNQLLCNYQQQWLLNQLLLLSLNRGIM